MEKPRPSDPKSCDYSGNYGLIIMYNSIESADKSAAFPFALVVNILASYAEGRQYGDE
jgi:hypothetical protein